MTCYENGIERLAELAERRWAAADLERWLIEHPELEADLVTAQRVRALVERLRAAEFEVPAGFEARVLARVRQDAALRSLLELGISGLGVCLIEVVAVIAGLAPRATTSATL